MKNQLNLTILSFILILQFQSLSAQNFKTVGYLPTYRFSVVDSIDLTKLTHLNIAFANPDVNGNLATNGVNITPIVQKGHNAGLKVFIALAGGAAQPATWATWIAANNRSAFIHRIINYVQQHNLDGVDVDIEWSVVNNDYSPFVLELKDSLDQYNLTMTAALPGTYRYPEVSNSALASFEWINIMAYDLTGPWQPNNPGPHSPYSFAVSSINYWTGQGLAKSKMVLGVPFYGYDFTNQSNVVSVKFGQMVDIDTAYAYIDQVGQIYYNGLNTIAQKTNLALNNNGIRLGGVMIWEIGQDDFGQYSLLNKIHETITDVLANNNIVSIPKVEAKLFPNPTRDIAYLNIKNATAIRISLWTSSMQMLKTWSVDNLNLIPISMQNYPQGVYFLNVEMEDFRKTFKLVVL